MLFLNASKQKQQKRQERPQIFQMFVRSSFGNVVEKEEMRQSVKNNPMQEITLLPEEQHIVFKNNHKI